MKHLTFFIILLLPISIFAQLSVSGYATQQLGLESNPLRNPASLLDNNGNPLDTLDLAPTTFSSYSRLYVKSVYKWDKASFTIKPRLTYRYYPAYDVANYFKADINQQFMYKPNKKWKFYQSFLFRSSQRQGAEQIEDLFSIPRSYNRYRLGIEAVYKLNRYWYFNTGVAGLSNQFQTEEDQINYYRALEATAGVKRKFKKGNKLRQITLDMSLQRRAWEIGTESEEEDEEDFNFTLMHYYNIAVSTELQLNDGWSWSPMLRFNGRKSENAKQNWHSFTLGSDLQWAKDKWLVKWQSRIYNRSFPNLIPLQEVLTPLEYVYFRNMLTVEYQATDYLALMATIQDLRRTSTFENEQRIPFRAYQNTYFGFGVKISF